MILFHSVPCTCCVRAPATLYHMAPSATRGAPVRRGGPGWYLFASWVTRLRPGDIIPSHPLLTTASRSQDTISCATLPSAASQVISASFWPGGLLLRPSRSDPRRRRRFGCDSTSCTCTLQFIHSPSACVYSLFPQEHYISTLVQAPMTACVF